MNDQLSSVPSASPSTPSKTSGLAIASLVFGILGIIWALPIVGPILAVVFGIVALNQIKKSGGTIKGQGQSIAGLVLGGVGLLAILMLLPAIARGPEKARRFVCLSNMKQIGLAISMYSAEHDGTIPRKFDDLKSYITSDRAFICPSARDLGTSSYQVPLGGKKWDRPETRNSIVLTEPLSNHYRSGRNVLYGDGRAQWEPASRGSSAN